MLVLTTGRLFCSRYVDCAAGADPALPGRRFPPLSYYQLWHDLTHASAPAKLAARAGARGGAQSRRPRHADASRRMTGAGVERVLTRSPSAATCSTSPPRRPGATSSRPAVRFRPDHWLLIEDGRIVGVQARGAGRRLAAPRPRAAGSSCPASSTPTCTARSSTSSPATAPSCSTGSTTHTFPAEARHADAGARRGGAARFLDALLAHGTTSAVVFPTVHGRRSTRSSPRPRRAACASSPARC